jgi:hypothetical protein
MERLQFVRAGLNRLLVPLQRQCGRTTLVYDPDERIGHRIVDAQSGPCSRLPTLDVHGDVATDHELIWADHAYGSRDR